jgi:23S rRNA pseudouridine1911/1915/1917 synthase
MQIIYEDNHLLVVNKPAGQLVQGDATGRPTLLDEAKTWLKDKYAKPGKVFLGLVHRLDRTASGVVVLARTSKAAARLSEEIRSHRPRKVYWALVAGKVPPAGRFVDRLERHEYTSQVVDAPGGKEASLGYNRLCYAEGVSLVEINLETGRHHQIRVQFAHRGFPILGDRRYGSLRPFASGAIALHARQMVIRHPTRGEVMNFVAEPGRDWPAERGEAR